MDEGFKHRHRKAALRAFCSRARAPVNHFSGYVEFGVGVSAQAICQLFQPGLQLWAGTGASHGAFHAKLKRHLLKDRTVLVLAVVYGVYEFVHQGVKHLNAIAQRRRDKDLIHSVGGGLGAPALANMAAFDIGAGKATGHMAFGDRVALFFKERRKRQDGLL